MLLPDVEPLRCIEIRFGLRTLLLVPDSRALREPTDQQQQQQGQQQQGQQQQQQTTTTTSCTCKSQARNVQAICDESERQGGGSQGERAPLTDEVQTSQTIPFTALHTRPPPSWTPHPGKQS
ncbi:unnamed protein product [Polarella glacialis]|uniref:Uncharacterized protein n=1 Tax=Polarella glacialis TaxID=89957 RepID=A0A813FBK3_POLGL|nr:unnamed protein product [Polarella glacialis]